MAYELNINAGVTGGQQVEQLGGATDKLTDRTKRLNDALYGQNKASEAVSIQTAKLAIEEAKLERMREQHRMSIEKLAAAAEAAANRQVAAQNRVTASLHGTVSGTQAASGALRSLEGNIPIRAAEQFLVKVLGFGPALQAVFPLVGAVAMLGIVEKMGEKLGVHIDVWYDISKAEKQATEDLKTYAAEASKTLQVVKGLQQGNFAWQAGTIAGAQREAESRRVDLSQAQANLGVLQQQRAAIEKYLRGATSFSDAELISLKTSGFKPGMGMISSEEDARIGKIAIKGLEAKIGPADAAVTKAQEEYARAQHAATDALNEEAAERQKTAKDAAAKAATIEKRQSTMDRTSREAFAKAFFGDELTPQRTLSVANERIEENRRTALGEPGADAARVNKDFDLQKVAAFMTYLDSSASALKKVSDDLDKTEHEIAKGMQSAEVKAAKEEARETLFKANPDIFGIGRAIAIPAGYTSPQQALRDARDNERRGMAQLGARNTLAGGSEGDLISATYSARIQYAKDELVAQLRIAAVKNDLVAKQDALDAMEQKSYDARLERENALLQIAVKQKQEFQSLAVGFLDAARSGNVGGFLRGQVNKIEDTIAGNAAGMIWPSVQKAMGGLHAGAGTTIGKLLEGTPFGPDPMKAATDLNTAATIENTLVLRAIAVSTSGGGGSTGGGVIGGFSSAASTIANLKFGRGTGIGEGVGYNDPLMATAGYGTPEFDAAGNVVTVDNPTAAAHSGFSFGKGVGIAGAAAAGAYGVYSGIHAGGAQGALTATGSALGSASTILSLVLPKAMATLGPIGIAIGMALPLISTLLGDPKQKEAQRIQDELKYNQYLAPVAIHASMTTGGTYSDFDRFGAPRGSGLSPFPTVSQGFFDYRNNVTVAGTTNSQFGGPGSNFTYSPQFTVMDATDVSRVLTRHAATVLDVINHGIQNGHGTGLQETLRNL